MKRYRSYFLETGLHIGRIWGCTFSGLLFFTFLGEFGSGWQAAASGRYFAFLNTSWSRWLVEFAILLIAIFILFVKVSAERYWGLEEQLETYTSARPGGKVLLLIHHAIWHTFLCLEIRLPEGEEWHEPFVVVDSRDHEKSHYYVLWGRGGRPNAIPWTITMARSPFDPLIKWAKLLPPAPQAHGSLYIWTHKQSGQVTPREIIVHISQGQEEQFKLTNSVYELVPLEDWRN